MATTDLFQRHILLRLENAPAKLQLQLESLLQRDPASIGLAFRSNRQTRIGASGCKEKVSSFFVGADLAVASSFKILSQSQGTTIAVELGEAVTEGKG